MILRFVVEFIDGTRVIHPVSCSHLKPLASAVAVLRTRVGIASGVKVDLRYPSGAPVTPWSKSPAQLQLQEVASLFLFVDCLPDEGTKHRNDGSRRSLAAEATPPQGDEIERGRVVTLGPSQAQEGAREPQSTSDSETDSCNSGSGHSSGSGKSSSSDPQPSRTKSKETVHRPAKAVALTLNCESDLEIGLHSFKRDGVFVDSFCCDRAQHGTVLLRELPLISVAYPMQLVQLIRADERLRTRTHPPCAASTPSSIPGVDDATFSEYLSVAMAYGHQISTADEYGTQCAFYPKILCIRHSCAPTAFVSNTAMAPPFEAVVRCCAVKGLTRGDEATVLWSAANTAGFMLLPRERRRRFLLRNYNFECCCPRCTSNLDHSVDNTLSGAFFHSELPDALASSMRDAFGALHIFDESRMDAPTSDSLSSCSSASPEELCQFVLQFSDESAALRLHVNHWRFSLARMALMEVCCTSPSREPDETVLTLALQQLETERQVIPDGHPLRLITFRRFLTLMSRASSALAGKIQRRAIETTNIDWELLHGLNRNCVFF